MGKINKDVLDAICADVTNNLTGWALEKESAPLSFVGNIELKDAHKIIDKYRVRLQLSVDHPFRYPSVFEIGGRIDRIPDNHVNGDGSVCLFVADESKRFWRQDTKISDFVNGPVRSYFIGHSYYEATGEWIFGERRHEIAGVLDFYYEQLGIDNILVLEKMLQFAVKERVKGHWPCPCNSGLKLRNCHMQKILELRETTETARMLDLLATFEKARQEARQPLVKK